MKIRSFFGAALASAVAAASPASADYVCKQVDVPGALETQLWQVNNAGGVAASSDVGGRTYSGGAWTALPPPPIASGYLAANLSALGINDSGAIAGKAVNLLGTQSQGFVLNGSTYSFFSYPGYSFTEPRALSNSGIVTGWAYNATLLGPAFVYNPGGAPGYPTGLTTIVPRLPSGTPASFSIPGAMNAAGQFVGSTNFSNSVRYGFVYDPSWAAHGGTQAITLFQIQGRFTAARGINDNGAVVGFTRDAAGKFAGFLQTSKGFQLIYCPELKAAGIFGESINNSDLFSGIWEDAAGTFHGFIAYPNVVLPVTSTGGVYKFDVAVAPNTPVFLDPPPAVGFQYAVGAGNPLFNSVTLPIGIGSNVYTLIVRRTSFILAAGEKLDFARNGFPAGVDAFEVLGIDPGANLDPADPTAFVTQVSFAPGGNGRFTGTMKPMTAADELKDLLLALHTDQEEDDGLYSIVLRAGKAYAAGDIPKACTLLTRFTWEVQDDSGEGDLSATFERALIAEADAIRNALSCPPAPPRPPENDGEER